MSDIETEEMDIQGILEHLPHRYPFLLVDKVIAYKQNESLTAIKNVSFNEPQFTGHFPQKPIFPGVLVIEALAQASGLLFYRSTGTTASKETIYYLVGIDKVRFKNPVVPGDQLELNIELLKKMRGVWKFNAIAKVGDKVITSAEIMCAERDA